MIVCVSLNHKRITRDLAAAVQGKPITGFTDSEEQAVYCRINPLPPGNALRELGADFEAGPDFQPQTQRDT